MYISNLLNKNIIMSSFKSSRDIQNKEGWPDVCFGSSIRKTSVQDITNDISEGKELSFASVMQHIVSVESSSLLFHSYLT